MCPRVHLPLMNGRSPPIDGDMSTSAMPRPLVSLLTLTALALFSLALPPQAGASTRQCGSTTADGVRYTVESSSWGMNHDSIEPARCSTARRLMRKAIRRRSSTVDGWMCSHRGRSVTCIQGASGGRSVIAVRRRAVAATAASADATRVVDCGVYAYFPNVLISSARHMTCRAAARDMRRHKRPIRARFVTPGGFDCGRVSGSAYGGQWRCVKRARAYRFEFGD
jgi:hypothetical protein